MTLSLQRRDHPLSTATAQKYKLEEMPLSSRFQDKLEESGLMPLRAVGVDTLQINVGRICNQVCQHCHVDAGPDRKELMSDEIWAACLHLLKIGNIKNLDITGGAPELHPKFFHMIREASATGVHVIHRCNLTAIMLNQYKDLPVLMAEHKVEIYASLPYYLEQQTDSQRGDGVFEISIKSMKVLNDLGYGIEGTNLLLHLVTNPVGAFLPGKQEALEKDWKRELRKRYQIEFNHLYTITNMPISRFLEFLVDSENLEGYMNRLVNAFNPAAVEGVMCRNMLSVGYDGALFDCDFNQMLEMPLYDAGLPQNILQLDSSEIFDKFLNRTISLGQHCYGCTAGSGSSCGGSTA